MPGSAAFEWSTPAEAQTKPWRVSAITSASRERTMRFVSRRITSSWRGSRRRRRARARGREASTSSSATTRPSAFETAFCATTTTSPSASSARAGDQRAEVVALARSPAGPSTGRIEITSGDAGDADPGVGPVAAVQVDDHRRQPLERAGARERAGVERAAGDDLRRQRERELLRARVVAADERVLVGRRLLEVRGGDRVETGDDRRPDERPGCARRASGASGSGRTPSFANASAARDREQRRLARARPRSSRAVSSAASALTASTARSAPRTASSFAAPRTRAAELAPRLAARSASREPITTSSSPAVDEPRGERAAEAAGAAEDRDPHASAPAASRTARARRRRAASSLISVRVTTARTPAGSSAGASASSITSASISPA